jgi:hypothetical protein
MFSWRTRSEGVLCGFEMRVTQIAVATANRKLVIASSIADAGIRYRIELRAIDCRSEKEVRISEEVADRNQVVHGLGLAVAQLRRKLPYSPL